MEGLCSLMIYTLQSSTASKFPTTKFEVGICSVIWKWGTLWCTVCDAHLRKQLLNTVVICTDIPTHIVDFALLL